jgi:NSS family neurotransmitter:Na+ symporter
MAREKWASRLGFVLASIGSAVGLGNIWRFPFQTATNGGAAFLVVYLIAVVCIGFAALLTEFVVGRRSQRNAIQAFDVLGHPRWTAVGVLALAGGFWVLSYYSVIGGWVIRYTVGSLLGATGATTGPLADPVGYFGVISTGLDAVALHAVFMGLTVGLVAFGVEDGIEKATKVMVPSIAVLLVALAAFAATLDGAGAGYDYFLSPDVGTITSNLASVIPAAVGQALFSLSIGFGVMITYASYIGQDDNLGIDGLSIAVFNTLVGVLAGLVVFPLLFAQGVSPETAGPGAVFVSVPTALAAIPAGHVVGVVFFGIVLIAALSSAISLLEVVVSYAVDRTDYSRVQAATALGGTIFLLGIPSALDTAWLGWFDGIAVNFVLPVVVLLVVVFVGWIMGESAVEEVLRGSDASASLGVVWLWLVRTLVLVAVAGTVVLGVNELVTGGGLVPPL